ncbi:hypothetical protein K2173_009428 [Erythroxylum novogranatense]|uniref:Choline kinase 2 n=1 Tax=Erythroxylum novogranatense TaxID=1862640 RepID=A0AAV8U3X1_9ROSI|nr:hypothetical protein K2173_009428 [Erythroxylum novogranatense]
MGTEGNNPENRGDRIPEKAKEMLKSLASKWEDVLDANALQIIPLKGAMTNEVFEIKWPTSTEEALRKVVVRIYGEGLQVFFNRDDEIRTFEFMSKQGQGPNLLGRFANGRIEEFVHARTLSASDVRDPAISVLIAAKLKEFHGLDMAGPKQISLWDKLRTWLKSAKTLCSSEDAESVRLDTIEGEIMLLEEKLSGDESIGFCHNDLQYGNIMIDEQTKSITPIDYEYASYNPIGFDIANYFCEMAADYHSDTPHVLDYSKYPGFEERKNFVRAYLNRSASGDQSSDGDLEQLLEKVEKYGLASHLFWGLWGLISDRVNEIDFDYMGYARQRFEQYWLRKPELLGSSEATPDGAIPGKEKEAAGKEVTEKEAAAEKTPGRTTSGVFRKIRNMMGFRRKSK